LKDVIKSGVLKLFQSLDSFTNHVIFADQTWLRKPGERTLALSCSGRGEDMRDMPICPTTGECSGWQWGHGSITDTNYMPTAQRFTPYVSARWKQISKATILNTNSNI